MPPVDLTPCGTCGEPVMFLEHVVTGKRAPINADPTELGNCVLEHTLHEIRYRVLLKGEPRPAPHEIYMPHFATCSAAARYRRPANVIPLHQEA